MALCVFSTFEYADILVVMVISAAIAFIEVISWLLIYRILAYNSVRSFIESSFAAAKKMVETSILAYGLILTIFLAIFIAVDLALIRSNFKSDIVITVFLAISSRLVNYIIQGRRRSAAEVPLLLKMTHRGLTGIATHCSMTFLHLLSITIQINFLRFCGSLLSMPDAKDQLTMMGMEPFDPVMCSSGWPNVTMHSTT